MCAFTPPNPNAFTPARRGPAGTSHGSLRAIVRKRVADSSERGSSQWSVGKSTPWWIASAALMSPATPAAGIVWPIIDLTEPSTARRPSPAGPNTCASVASSAPSPAGVPVPCASTRPTVAGSSRAASHARRSASTCPSIAGVMRLAERPSLDTPVPRITAYTRSPARSASASRLSTTMPTPSPMSRPSARRSKGRIASERLSAPSWQNTL
jgi:hypothetical protein